MFYLLLFLLWLIKRHTPIHKYIFVAQKMNRKPKKKIFWMKRTKIEKVLFHFVIIWIVVVVVVANTCRLNITTLFPPFFVLCQSPYIVIITSLLLIPLSLAWHSVAQALTFNAKWTTVPEFDKFRNKCCFIRLRLIPYIRFLIWYHSWRLHYGSLIQFQCLDYKKKTAYRKAHNIRTK